ncbi:MAG: arsenite S-adenosylmethyltransferase, partial [Abditibacteriaceae bacterium]
GAIEKQAYLDFISGNGFTNIIIQKEKPIIIPDDILRDYLDEAEMAAFTTKETSIQSITVYAEKPATGV